MAVNITTRYAHWTRAGTREDRARDTECQTGTRDSEWDTTSLWMTTAIGMRHETRVRVRTRRTWSRTGTRMRA